MEWEGREESSNVDDQRGFGRKAGIIGGGAGILVMIVAALLGINPQQFAGLLGTGQQSGPADPDEERLAKFTKVIFHDTEVVWGEQFKKMGKDYKKPTLVLFSGQVRSACGEADAAVGPFYCPGDQRVYIDLSFYKDMEKKLDAPGEFARAYVVAHEVGHHVQKLLGYADRSVDHKSVRLELQADYFAGVWAYHANAKYHDLEKSDIESAMHAAFEIGDDRLQKKSGHQVVPDSFTHGTSKQRMYWFMEGYKSGSVEGAKRLFDLDYDKL